MKISLCIPTYNRADLCIESFAQVIDDDRIDDIVLMDDKSTNGSYAYLKSEFGGHSKVVVLQQEANVGMARNKRDAIDAAKNDWAILFDDDNTISPDYLDALGDIPGVFELEEEIFMPSFAKPNFDYRDLCDTAMCKQNIAHFMSNPIFGALINTCNYVVNKKYYLETWQANPEMKATDTAWHLLCHLKAGGSMYVVPGMEYFHRVHDQSGFMQDVAYNMKKAKEIEEKIKKLSYGDV